MSRHPFEGPFEGPWGARRVAESRTIARPSWSRVAVLLALLLAVSCRKATRGDPRQAVRESVETHGALERTFQTRHEALRRELARLVGEQATPSQMTANNGRTDRSAPTTRRADIGPPDERNAAIGMIDAIPDASCRALQRRLRDAYPESAAQIMDASRHDAWWKLLDTHASETAAYRCAVAWPICDFGTRFTHGLLLDTTALDRPLIGNRLLALSAIRAIVENRAADAVVDLAAMFRGVEWMAGAHHVTARVAAARMRGEALHVVAFLAQHAHTRDADLLAVHDLLSRHIDAMPAESGAWRGERAIGLHAYEMARAGRWFSLLSHREFAAVRATGIEAMHDETIRNIDEDEWCYLRIMRDLVDLARRPYHHRRERLDSIRSDLDEPLPKGGRPAIAKFLLQDVAWVQRTLARDQALVEGWRIAFALATGNSVPSELNNPATGRPFEWTMRRDDIAVRGLDVPEDEDDARAMGPNATAMMRWFRVPEPIRVKRIHTETPSTDSGEVVLGEFERIGP